MVTTIHQPSSRLFSKFDKLILLSKGCSLYFGKASEAMLYFSSIGYLPLMATNPAEFLIDLANGNTKNKSIPSQLQDIQCEDTGPSPVDVHQVINQEQQNLTFIHSIISVPKYLLRFLFHHTIKMEIPP